MAFRVNQSPHLVEFLSDVGGAKSIDVVQQLFKKDEIDEFRLAETLDMSVKSIRRILYRLYDKKLVSFRKTRDKKRGWYIYIWRLEEERLTNLLEERKKRAISELRSQLEYEANNQFFKCEFGCIRANFEEAFEMEFVCPECGGKLHHFDNQPIVDQLRKYIDNMEMVVGG